MLHFFLVAEFLIVTNNRNYSYEVQVLCNLFMFSGKIKAKSLNISLYIKVIYYKKCIHFLLLP